jgi:hypothetical protein
MKGAKSMSEADKIATWDVLRDFGFQIDAKVIADQQPGLSYDFGNFKLDACSVKNRWFVDIVLFGGIMATTRTLGEVEFEVPRLVQSKEECAAWIAWGLDNSADGGIFRPARETDWLHLGRTQKHLLPWERNQEAQKKADENYRARPHCFVERDWLKLGLKSLEKYLMQVADGERLDVDFDGKHLWLRLAKNSIVLPAEGARWEGHFTVPTARLHPLPKRLMSESIEISVWRGQFQIDQSWFDGVIKSVSRSTQTEEQQSQSV